MSRLALTEPLTFEPVFMERIWGGRRLETQYGKKLPPEVRIGESWEISDRPEAQSVVKNGPLRGKTLHDLWMNYREEVFGELIAPPSRDPGRESPARGQAGSALPNRFPLLVKLLDAREKLSLQVHPPEAIAARLGGEPKTEFWYIVQAEPGAKLYVGLRQPSTQEEFQDALNAGTAANHVHTIPVKTGDAIFLPSGRFHAIGAGNLIVEIQQNSDTTYRVFDWNRVDDAGKPRQLHIEQALECIDFNDCAPRLVEAQGEQLVRDRLFEVRKWNLTAARELAPPGQFAIVFCLTGAVRSADIEIDAGEFMLLPAQLKDRDVSPQQNGTSILRVTIPL